MRKLQAVVPSDRLQAVPVATRGTNVKFEILNVLDVVSCVDAELSEIQLFTDEFPQPLPGRYESFDRFVADARQCQGHDLFRVDRWNVALLCSDRIRDLLLANNVTGIRFEPVELSHLDELTRH
jgi:hypothetical protein